MSDATGQRIVLITTAAPDDRLATELATLTGDYSPPVVAYFSLSATPRARASAVVDAVVNAAYVVIQEPACDLPAEHIAAAAVAQTHRIPLLLICPTMPTATATALTTIANAPPSQIINYPARADDEEAWTALHKSLEEKAFEIGCSYERAQRVAYLRPIIQRLSSVEETLTNAAPDEHIARIIASTYDSHLDEMALEEHVEFLQMDLPAGQYPYLLSRLTGTFPLVRTIADPATEKLPWDDPVDSSRLSTVSERIFVIDERHAQQYGLESVLREIAMGIRTGGGATSIVGLDADLRSQIQLASTANPRLFGLNRFYAGDTDHCKIIGGYADKAGTRVRLLAFHDQGAVAGANKHELQMLSMIDERKKGLPLDRAQDLTALASWAYSNVLSTPSLSQIYFRERPEYADNYDGNIVRVTPGYYSQLDAVSNEIFHSLIAQYSPGAEQGRFRILELGFGTGALTGRLLSVCSKFMALMHEQTNRQRPFVELDGWDSNARMVDIATHRLGSWRESLKGEVSLQPNLERVDFNAIPARIRDKPVKYDLVVGSLFSHYWIDLGSEGAVSQPEHLQQFRLFIQHLRTWVKSGGDVILLDVAYSVERREQEQRAWREYVARELESEGLAGEYFDHNPKQYLAPNTDVIGAVADSLGFNVSWRESLPGYPFRILHLRSVLGAEGGDQE
jgi:hypothetical protein